MRAGSFEIFVGPIVDSTGEVVLAEGVVADQEWRDTVGFYVQSVLGEVPAK